MNSKNTVIPPDFKITKCPAQQPPENRFVGIKQKSVYTLLKEEEKALELGYSGRVEMLKAKSSNNYERYIEAFHEAKGAGMTTSEALDFARIESAKK